MTDRGQFYVCSACGVDSWIDPAPGPQSPEEARVFPGLKDTRITVCNGCGHILCRTISTQTIRDLTREEAERVKNEPNVWNALRQYVDHLFSPQGKNWWG